RTAGRRQQGGRPQTTGRTIRRQAGSLPAEPVGDTSPHLFSHPQGRSGQEYARGTRGAPPAKAGAPVSGLARHLVHDVAGADDATDDDSRIGTSEAQLPAFRRIDKEDSVPAEPGGELVATSVGFSRHLNDCGAELETAASRQVAVADVEIE